MSEPQPTPPIDTEFSRRRFLRGAVLAGGGIAAVTLSACAPGIHFHGQKLPNAMDGVPHIAHDPILPVDSFAYEFTARTVELAAGCSEWSPRS